MAALGPKAKSWKDYPKLALCLFVLVSVGDGMIHNMMIPQGLDDCFTRYASKTSIRHTVGQSINWICVHQYMWLQNGQYKYLGYNVTGETNVWFSQLLRFPKRNSLHTVGNEKVRKEIRMLTDVERYNFLRAVQMLKADTSIYPNKYDALAALHQGITETAAHGGPNFVGWHRVMLIMFENAIREKIPSVTLPYWDSTLDEPMKNPLASVMWSDSFMGNCNGLVNTGPFADWMTPAGPLIRNCGNTGQLFRRRVIKNIMTRKHLGEITEPHAFTEFNLEFHHGEVHVYVDGQMGELTKAAMDPIFFLHHCFIDYVWEKFRERQRMNGIDPTRDYPSVVNHTLHLPTAMLGLGTFRNIDSFSDYIVKGIYRYEDSPTCSSRKRSCGSDYFKCVFEENEWICVSKDQSSVPRSHSFMNMQGGMGVSRSFQQQMAALGRLQIPNMNLQINRIGPNTLLNSRPAMINHMGQNVFMSVQRDSMKPMGFKIVEMRNSNLPRIRGTGSDVNRVVNSIVGQNPQASSQETCPVIPVNRPYQNSFNINGVSDMRQWVYLAVDVVYKRPPDYERYNAFPIFNNKPHTLTDIYEPDAYRSIKAALNTGRPASYHSCNTGQFGAGAVFIQSNGINYIGTYKEYAIVDHRMAISSSTAFVAVKNPGFGQSQVLLTAYDSCGRICRAFCKIPNSPTGAKQRCSGLITVTSSFPKLYARDYGEAVYNTWGLGLNCPEKNERHVYMTFYCDYEEEWPMPGVVPIIPPTPPPMPVLLIPSPSTAETTTSCEIGNGCVIAGKCRRCALGSVQRCQNNCSLYARCVWGTFTVEKCPSNMIYNQARHLCLQGTCSEEVEPTVSSD